MAHLLRDFLSRESFDVTLAHDADGAIEQARTNSVDAIVLDVMLPGRSGLDVLRELKASGRSSNVIIISAKDSLEDKLAGLDLGADDYLVKPFHIAELNARVRSVLRRKELGGSNTIAVANVVMDLDARTAEVCGAAMPLNRKEFDMLTHFMLNKDRLVSRGSLAEHVWGDHADQGDDLDFVYSQIKNLRKRLKQAGASVEIQAVYGIGYKLVEA